MYGRKDLVKITTLTNLSAILHTIKKCLGTPHPTQRIVVKPYLVYCQNTCSSTENIRPCIRYFGNTPLLSISIRKYLHWSFLY